MPASSTTLAPLFRQNFADGYLSNRESALLVSAAKTDGGVSDADKAAMREVLANNSQAMSDSSRALMRRTFGEDIFETVSPSPTPVTPDVPVQPDPVIPDVVDPITPRRDLEDPGVLTKDAGSVSFDWVDGALFKDGVTAEDVVQGSIANCYMVAAFSAVAKQSPEAIENAITDNGDGTYTVRLHDVSAWGSTTGRVTEVLVDGELPVSGSSQRYAKGADRSELWVGILEKAFAQSKGSYETIGNGGSPAMVMTALTGRRSSYVGLSTPTLTDERVFEQMKATLEAGGGICAATYGKDQSALYTGTGLYAWHAYSVLGVSEEDGTQYVTLRNPWGRSEPTGNGEDDGIFKLDIAAFRKLYAGAYLA